VTVRRVVAVSAIALIATIAIAAALTSCSSSTAEGVLISRFFAVSRLRDLTSLQTLATVSFEPNVQGIITDFEITNVTPERQDAALVSKDVSISAPVQLPTGQTAQKNFVITMQRARPGRDPNVIPGWMITAITEAQAPVSSPRS
jgi:hypothetical protein